MALSMIECYLTPLLRSELSKWTRVFLCFLLTALVAPVVLLFGAVVVLLRLLVAFHFKLVHDGKFILLDPSDGAYAVEKYANAIAVNTFGFVKGQTDISQIQDKFLNKFIGYKAEDGRQPYIKLTWKLLQKYGFFAWEIENDSFDIRDHVRLCPGTDYNTVYSEQGVLEAVEKLLDDLMNPKRPQWEMLYVPKVRMDKDGELHYALIFRAQHSYMDGISVIHAVKRGLTDEPGELNIDPVNPPIPKISMIQQIALYAQTFFMAPHTYIKGFPTNHNIFQEMTENLGPKYMQCTNKEITLESVKLIRNRFKCSTTALFNSVTTGALRRAAKRKNLPIPDEVDFAYTTAVLPYPNEDPQNRFTIKMLQSPFSISDPVKRLNQMNSVMKQIAPHEVLALYTLGLMIGLLPSALIRKVYTTVSCGYAFSNLPGYKETQRLNGDPFVEIYGCPPIKSGVCFGVGVCSYNGKIRACWLVEKSKIVSSRDEMNALISDFETEFAQLECIANGNN